MFWKLNILPKSQIIIIINYGLEKKYCPKVHLIIIIIKWYSFSSQLKKLKI